MSLRTQSTCDLCSECCEHTGSGYPRGWGQVSIHFWIDGGSAHTGHEWACPKCIKRLRADPENAKHRMFEAIQE